MDSRENIHRIASIIIIVVILVGTVIIHMNYEKNAVNSLQGNLKIVAESTSTSISKQICTNQCYLKMAGNLLSNIFENTDDFYSENVKHISKVFEEVNSADNIVTNLCFVDEATGNSITSKGIFNMKDSKIDYRTRNWYVEAKTSKNTVISDAYNDINTDKPCITISYAIYKKNKFVGVVAEDMFLENMNYYLLNSHNYNALNLYVFSPTGKAIIHPDKNMLGKIAPENNTDSEDRGGYFIQNYELNWKLLVLPRADILNKKINNNLLMIFYIGFIICCILLIAANYYIANSYKISNLTGLNTRYKLINDVIRKSYLSSTCLLFISIKELNSVSIEYGYNEVKTFLINYAELLRKLFNGEGDIYSINERDFVVTFKSSNYEEIFDSISNRIFEMKHCNITIKNDDIKADVFLTLFELNRQEIKSIKAYFPKLENVVKDLRNGKESFVYGKPQQFINDIESRKRKVMFLKKAIKEDRLVPFFQPLADIKTHEIQIYEVLMRIKDKDNFLAPYPYIIMAEKYNLIQDIDLMILNKAIEYKTKVDKEDKIIFAFNMSGKSLNDSNYLNKVSSIIDKYNVKHENIILEITETQNIENIDELLKLVNKLKKSNYKFSIDDFGTGFSSIYYLKNIPVDYIKIDGSFIKDINEKKENLYLVKSIINMAKAFELKIVAEFVENKGILDTLEKLDVDYVQGYYIGKPSSELQKVF